MKMDFHFPHFLNKMKRKTAVILPKDAGAIISYCGLNKKDIVVEIGGGSGFLTAYLSNICSKVIVYESNTERARNLEKKFNSSNVIIKNEDGINANEDADVYVFDTANATDILNKIYPHVKRCVVGYFTNIERTKEFYLTVEKYFNKTFALQIQSIEWDINTIRAKPKHMQLYHTGFLVFGFL